MSTGGALFFGIAALLMAAAFWLGAQLESMLAREAEPAGEEQQIQQSRTRTGISMRRMAVISLILASMSGIAAGTRAGLDAYAKHREQAALQEPLQD